MGKANGGGVLLVAVAGLLLGCVEIVPAADPAEASADSLRSLPSELGVPTLRDGQVWYVTTAFLGDGVSAPEWDGDVPGRVTLELAEGRALVPSEGGAAVVAHAASISWELRVVEAAFAPEPGSEWAEAARSPEGAMQSVALVEASLYGERGLETSAKDLAPRYALLIRRSDFRLLEARFSYLSGEARVSERLALEGRGEGGAAGVVMPDHCLLDFVMPEFPLDQGHDQMTVRTLAEGATEVAFTSPVTGDLVVQRWDTDRPWFATSRSFRQMSWSHAAAPVGLGR